MFSTRLLSVVAAISTSVLSSSVLAGETVFYITEDGGAADGVSVSVAGQRSIISPEGFVSFDLPAGAYVAEFTQFGEYIGEADIQIPDSDAPLDVLVEVLGGEAVAETVTGEGDGVIAGRLISSETGGAVSGARVAAAGTEAGAMTDDQGRFSFSLPRGTYTVTVAHPSYNRKEMKNIHAMAGKTVDLSVELGMSGSGVIEEVVAVGSYNPDSATSQERDSSAVLDSIGSEQMSRFGDSNAASAIKRVVGVTVADGKYVVARGLNERHTSIMLNGASLPSPDPTRRVVPLDIFPSSVIKGIDVQKTGSPDVYADATGSTVKLSTKKFPLEFEGKVSLSLGYNDAITFQDREWQQQEGMDFWGFGSSGDRSLPEEVKTFDSSNVLAVINKDGERLASEMPDTLATEEINILPDMSAEVSVGDTFADDGDVAWGYMASLKYSNSWEGQDRKINTNNLSEAGEVIVDDDYREQRTSNDINLGFGLTVGLLMGDSEYTSNTLLLRQTYADTSVKEGQGGDQDRIGKIYSMDWQERELFMQQFLGDHYFPSILNTEVNWQVSMSQASLDNPDRRSYTFERPTEEDPLHLYWSSIDREYNELTDDVFDWGLDIRSQLFSSSGFAVSGLTGLSAFTRERVADGTQIGYKYSGNGNPQFASDYPDELNPDSILADEIDAGNIAVQNNTLGSSDYDATWDMLAYYFGIEIEEISTFRLNAGLRSETSDIVVNTFSLTSTQNDLEPVAAELSDSEMYPSVSTTFYVTENIQLRGAWYETLNRPDFRELANAQYVDPESGDVVRGFSELKSAEVTNYDMRAEWYFSEEESVSLAYFVKDFISPIEKTLLTGGAVFSYRNGDSGSVNGVELDFRKNVDFDSFMFFVSGNISLIDSEVEISGRSRAMQGQPDTLANIQLGIDDADSLDKYTLVYNYQGESLYSATQVGSSEPDIIREPRAELSFNYSTEIAADLTLKLSLKNIFDEKVSLTQEGENYRSYHKGMEASLGASLVF